MIPCSAFIEWGTKCGRGRRRQTNSARISHPPPFRRVTKNVLEKANLHCKLIIQVNQYEQIVQLATVFVPLLSVI